MNIGLILSIIAGLSTLIGALIILFVKGQKNNIIVSTLSFSASIMIFISLLDLIPQSYKIAIKYYEKIPSILNILLFFIIGIIIAILLDRTLPVNINNKDSKLYHIGIFSMIAIIIHNIPEGMATFIASNTNLKLGISITIAIALHNIPEGISICLPIYYSTNNINKALLYSFIAAIAEPFGAIVTMLFLKNYINETTLSFLFPIISGIMIYIAINELLKEAISYNKKKLTILAFIIGIIFIIFNKLFF